MAMGRRDWLRELLLRRLYRDFDRRLSVIVDDLIVDTLLESEEVRRLVLKREILISLLVLSLSIYAVISIPLVHSIALIVLIGLFCFPVWFLVFDVPTSPTAGKLLLLYFVTSLAIYQHHGQLENHF